MSGESKDFTCLYLPLFIRNCTWSLNHTHITLNVNTSGNSLFIMRLTFLSENVIRIEPISLVISDLLETNAQNIYLTKLN